MPQPAALSFLGSPRPVFPPTFPSGPASALAGLQSRTQPGPAQPQSQPWVSPAPAPAQPSPSPGLCPTPGPRVCPASGGPAGPGPRAFGQKLCPLCQAVGRPPGTQTYSSRGPQELPGHGRDPGPVASCSAGFPIPGTAFPRPASPSPSPSPLGRRPPHPRPSTPSPGAGACHRAPSINNRSGPTDHSPTRPSLSRQGTL